MTAEIAVMNRQAVALAADSAATVSLPHGQKIYNSLNKLFTLSKYAPVGIMIYGQAQISGVPWETVIKEFRRELGRTRYSTLVQYVEGFFAFLESKNSLFPREQQAAEITGHCYGLFQLIRNDIEAQLRSLFDSQGTVREGQIRRVSSNAIRRQLDDVGERPALPGFSPDYCDQLRSEFG